METLKGYIEKITYRNEETGYTVLTLDAEGESHCLVGTFPAIDEGEFIEAEGNFTVHPAYGPQMKVEKYTFTVPGDAVAIERYLSSGAVKGIGEKLAKRIVAVFGDDTFRILEEEPERLAEIKGISERAAMNIAEQVIEKREARNAMLFLQQYGVSVRMAAKIYRRYGEDLYRVLRENPYRLAEDISGIGFRAADEIAAKMNIAMDSEFRIRAAVLYELQLAAQNGHTYLPKDELFSAVEGLLNLCISDFDHLLDGLLVDRCIAIRKDGPETAVYLRSYFTMEQNTALMLKNLNINEGTGKDDKVLRRIESLEKEMGVTLDPLQREAILTAHHNGITILTGGPGTGKTTTINVMIRHFLAEGLDLLLAAPTGRAAKRMTETTGYEAQTIHRLLEMSGNPDDPDAAVRFNRNDKEPLEADVVIIDEVSMVDVMLMHALLRAMVPGMRLILVGDMDQLPSVGPGEVLKDLILSDCFPVVKLNKIFRQAGESDIIVNAHKINEGEVPEPKPSKDFLFIKREDPGQIVGATITLLREKLPKYVQADMRELQVLTPMRKGVLGVENLNKVLQEAFNPPAEGKPEQPSGDRIFRVGDKVMQIKNNYYKEWTEETKRTIKQGLGVFNGDIGFVDSINPFSKTLIVEFDDGKKAEYPFSELEELEHAYAVTIHKAQGSEYPAIVIPMFQGPEMLLNRNLIYTGVTRARKCVCLVGRFETFARMVRNGDVKHRYTGLRALIRDAHAYY